jgi:hypothetical protein
MLKKVSVQFFLGVLVAGGGTRRRESRARRCRRGGAFAFSSSFWPACFCCCCCSFVFVCVCVCWWSGRRHAGGEREGKGGERPCSAAASPLSVSRLSRRRGRVACPSLLFRFLFHSASSSSNISPSISSSSSRSAMRLSHASTRSSSQSSSCFLFLREREGGAGGGAGCVSVGDGEFASRKGEKKRERRFRGSRAFAAEPLSSGPGGSRGREQGRDGGVAAVAVARHGLARARRARNRGVQTPLLSLFLRAFGRVVFFVLTKSSSSTACALW